MVFDKKGNMVIGMVLVLVMVFVAGITAVFMDNIVEEINVDIQSDDSFGNESKTIISNHEERYNGTADGMIAFILAGLWILVLVFAFIGTDHPIMYVFLVLIIIIIALVGGILSNSWDDLINESEFSDASSEFPITNFILSNFLLVIIIIGFSALMVIFIKNRFYG